MLFVALFTQALFGNIRQATTLAPIQEETNKCDEQTLLLIDVSGTLLASNVTLLHAHYKSWRDNWFQKQCPELSLNDQRDLLAVISHDRNTWRLTENWEELLTHTKAKTAALTRSTPESPLSDIRLDKLYSFSLPFSKLDLPSYHLAFSYQEGVIRTESPFKSIVIEHILKYLHPKKLILIDDTLTQLSSVERLCKHHHIPFIGFHYTKPIPLLNKQAAHIQLQHLVRTQHFLNATPAYKTLRASHLKLIADLIARGCTKPTPDLEQKTTPESRLLHAYYEGANWDLPSMLSLHTSGIL